MDKPLNDATHHAAQNPPAPRAVPFAPDYGTTAFLQELERLVMLQQEPLVILKLATYAADAMRVLHMLERHAGISQPFADMIKASAQTGATLEPSTSPPT